MVPLRQIRHTAHGWCRDLVQMKPSCDNGQAQTDVGEAGAPNKGGHKADEQQDSWLVATGAKSVDTLNCTANRSPRKGPDAIRV
jgi:hypothetical protein